MVSMLARAKVKDFQAWKKVYDEAADLRASFGGGADQVFQDASDPNTYIAIIKCISTTIYTFIQIITHSFLRTRNNNRIGILLFPTDCY